MIEIIKKNLKAHLKPSRYKHTLGVCKLAVSLAKHYNVSEKDTEIAALLHDYHKYANDQDILDTFKNMKRDINSVIQNHPNLGHGYMSAVYAKETYDVKDDIFNAIANHTFGRKGMSTLEKIIYLADALEEGRSFEGVELIRSTLYTDLDETVLSACENTLLFEIKRGNMIHVQTILMRNEILEAK